MQDLASPDTGRATVCVWAVEINNCKTHCASAVSSSWIRAALAAHADTTLLTRVSTLAFWLPCPGPKTSLPLPPPGRMLPRGPAVHKFFCSYDRFLI